jgi:hypothetical protein
MATELQIREQLRMMRFLPPQLARLERLLGTVQWPGQRQRLNFPLGMALSEQERQAMRERMKALESLTTGENLHPAECSMARLSLLTKLLLGYPAAGGSTEKAAEARLGFYLDAVGDIAPWALDAAIKRWVRGEVENANVDFAPSPGTLRRLCEEELSPFVQQIAQIQRLLSAVSIDRAMDPTPIMSLVERKEAAE